MNMKIRVSVPGGAPLGSLLMAFGLAACSGDESDSQRAAYEATCQGPPLRSATERNQAMEDGYAINAQFDCIDKASFAAVAAEHARWVEANSPEGKARREAEHAQQRAQAKQDQVEREEQAMRLADARQGFKSRLLRRESAQQPVPEPPAEIFRTVRYSSPAGHLAAYLSPNPGDGRRHPAIIWITGGDANTIGDVWSPAPASNDQSAAAYRKAGIVMMFPSLRGGNNNPGVREGFFGEVDDVIAAADFLAQQDYVDPARIYLGGHSTGGTLALLVAEASDRFRAVFSFGPVADVRAYGPAFTPFTLEDPREIELRAPGRWLSSLRVPTFVFEGTGGNIDELEALAGASVNPRAHFLRIRGADHFSSLAPTNTLIAAGILSDNGPTCDLSFSEASVSAPFAP